VTRAKKLTKNEQWIQRIAKGNADAEKILRGELENLAQQKHNAHSQRHYFEFSCLGLQSLGLTGNNLVKAMAYAKIETPNITNF
jgi:hypothetical protein